MSESKTTHLDKLEEKYMQYSFFRRAMAQKEESQYVEYITRAYHDCIESGELIRESDGQFTGGHSSEVYRYTGDVYEFYFHADKLEEMQRYDGVLYEK